jgi:hypothetical protein
MSRDGPVTATPPIIAFERAAGQFAMEIMIDHFPLRRPASDRAEKQSAEEPVGCLVSPHRGFSDLPIVSTAAATKDALRST